MEWDALIYLVLTGNLSAPGDLEVIAGQSTIHLKWNAPFSLQGVDIEGYFVTFVEVTDANASTTETIYLNNTEREKKFTTESLLPCHVYQFFVGAYNAVGNGNLSNVITSFQSGK